MACDDGYRHRPSSSLGMSDTPEGGPAGLCAQTFQDRTGWKSGTEEAVEARQPYDQSATAEDYAGRTGRWCNAPAPARPITVPSPPQAGEGGGRARELKGPLRVAADAHTLRPCVWEVIGSYRRRCRNDPGKAGLQTH
eukprot:CAMPEP_0174698800 /NCGR_PEP_ID=MMETSP1094-20130205/4292_1 /TAXON_ID=156173 /ORGANISM="Chrysochromulina brevifilum, Strain UTEX LB 985" /LENGTH=137 /DNA_ID=CAMNT_0015896029 /DNA_START=189 /DNA_END=604 /DNA_ORIENTATION=-